MKKISHAPPHNFTDLLLDAVCVVDRDGSFLFVSAASEQIFGYKPEEMIGKAMIDFVHPGDKEKTLNTVNDIMSGELKPYFENRYVRKDGKTAHIMWSARWSESEQIRVAVARDVTELKHAQSMQAALYAISEAANSPGDLTALFQRIHDVVDDLLSATNFVVALYDSDNNQLHYPYYAHPDNIIATPKAHILHTLTSAIISTKQTLLLTPENAQSTLSHLGLGTSLKDQYWLGAPLKSANNLIGALVVFSSTEDARFTEQDRELLQFIAIQVAAAVERKKMYSQLEHMARHDQLTNLPNRALFLDRLQTALARAHRGHSKLAILYLDLDKFKQVNDTYGHITGDHLLQEVARRLTDCIRESDTVGRLGGDEFIVLLDDIAQREDTDRLKTKIITTLSEPYTFAQTILHITPSIGVAVYPENGTDSNALIRYADDAMYQVKRIRA
jgi:diguanylate cyclase (GGDEF)-like protein/PAS domain S-box-containing protein